MLPPRTSTAPTIGFGLVLPAPLSARRNARRMYLLSRSSSIRLKKARPRVSQHRLGSALTAGGVSQDRCNSSLGERALGCGRWSSALTETFRLYLPRLTPAPPPPPPPPPPGSLKKGGGLAEKAKTPGRAGKKPPPNFCLARRGWPPERPL